MPKNLVPTHRSVVLLGILLAGIISTAFSNADSSGWVILMVGYVFLSLGGAYLLGASGRWWVAVAVFALPMIVLDAIVLSSDPTVGLKVAARLCALGMLGLFLAVVVNYSLLSASVRKADRVLAGICGYLLIALLWSNLFFLIETVSPRSFAEPTGDELTRVDFLYFSLTSLSTLGYGDMLPLSDPARIASVLESVVGVLYLAVFISALVARPSEEADSE